MEFINNSDASNNRGNWSHLKFIQKIPQHHCGKGRNQGTKKKRQSYWHCKRASVITNQMHKTVNMGNTSTCNTICKYRVAAKIYTLERWFVSRM